MAATLLDRPDRPSAQSERTSPSASIEGRHVVVVGGGSGMGLATAVAAHAAGARVTIAGRSPDKLAAAADRIGSQVATGALDIADPAQVTAFFAAAGQVDHLVITASGGHGGSLKELPFDDALAAMRSKFWGPYLCAAQAQISPDGSITLFSGVLARRPAKGQVALACVNAAVEALGRALALELAPVRVNTISPGLVDSGVYDRLGAEARDAMFASAARALPVGHVGQVGDLAAAALALMTNPFITGATLDVDGGAMLASSS